MQYQGRSKRTRTGARVRPHDKKQKIELGRDSTETQVGERSLQVVDARGNDAKVRALSTNVANVTDDDGTTENATIEDVVENPANPNYARRNIITKGATIETSAGRARVTSRPGQTGVVNAVLVE
ncbi:MAG: 30S ribosomal protein S8e [Halobacteriaceae archaeon]